jgi:hypothetical protein
MVRVLTNHDVEWDMFIFFRFEGRGLRPVVRGDTNHGVKAWSVILAIKFMTKEPLLSGIFVNVSLYVDYYLILSMYPLTK